MTGIGDTPATRLVTPDDAEALADLVRRNREFLAPWEPVRPDDHLTVAGQRSVIAGLLAAYDAGTGVPFLVLDADGEPAGRVTLSNIVRGPFQSASLGYWVSADRNGRGLASAAVGDMVTTAFDHLGLHRVEAGTLVDNAGSQRVLVRNGFTRVGLAPRYLRIAGEWRDHLIYQRLADDP